NTVVVRAPAAQVDPAPGRGEATVVAVEKPGFLQRLNPARWDTAKLNPGRWFGDPDKSPATNSAPAPRPAVTPLAPAMPPVQVARAMPSPAASETSRYTYQSPPRPAPGDRAAAQALFTEGVAEQRSGRPAEALARYREAARLDPAFFDVHYNAAIAALAVGSLPAALSASEMALVVQPDSTDGRYNFALALERSGYLVDAAVELEKLVQQRPDSVNGHLLLGNLYADPLRRPADARDHYRRVLELNPNHPQAPAIRRWLAANP
ncbi:MAG: tetratricopeptide repeat protein, partial [Limisphaerales bacterium]